ncbi:MAG TPA: HPr family phosphocarrier protein [Micromonosporaceae bacterium]|jgi:phosphotransferase system HPr (HPr) family protein
MSGSSETRVVLTAALHARPAGQVVQAATRFSSEIEISYGERTVSARGVLGVMALGATAGTTVVLRAIGDDAAEAVTALAAVLATATD